MRHWRVWVYVLGTIVSVLSKILVPLALHVILLAWHLPEQVMICLLGKGPFLVIGTILIFFGMDHLLSPTGAILGAGRERKYALLPGVFVLVLGIIYLYLALVGPVVEIYDDRFLPSSIPPSVRRQISLIPTQPPSTGFST